MLFWIPSVKSVSICNLCGTIFEFLKIYCHKPELFTEHIVKKLLRSRPKVNVNANGLRPTAMTQQYPNETLHNIWSFLLKLVCVA